MRKLWILVVLGILFGCASSSVTSVPDDLDMAIRDASDYLNNNIPAGSKIVILNIQSSSAALTDYIIDELIANAVNDRIFSVVDRAQLDLIRQEQNFQWAGEVSDQTALEIGNFFGAQTIVSGRISELGDRYRITIRALEVQTAQVQGQYNRNMAAGATIAALMGSRAAPQTATQSRTAQQASVAQGSPRMEEITVTFVNNTGSIIRGLGIMPSDSSDASDLQTFTFRENIRNGESRRTLLPQLNTAKGYLIILNSTDDISYVKNNVLLTQNMTLTFDSSERWQDPAQTTSSTQPTTPTQPQTQVTPAQSQSSVRTYRIGDTGPAGGLIFYDKGNNSNGWRYLEAAPEEAEFRAVWSVHRTQVDNLQAGIGSGRRNTQLIVEKYRQTAGEWDTAAQQAEDLVFNGFDDWFLPSQDELDQMYGNLKRRNLGDFKNEWYWSSSVRSTVQAHVQNFRDGQMSYELKDNRYYVRPIRQVAGPS